LAEGLRRALGTSPAEIARMGSLASTSIRRICDPLDVVERQLSFRRRLAKQRMHRSLSVALPEMPAVAVQPVPFRIKQLRRLKERLASLGCLISNPIISIRVLRALTNK